MPDTQITTYPLDGITYDAADAAGYCATRTSGVYSSEADFAVTPAGGMRITVSAGQAWVHPARWVGYSIQMRTATTLEMPVADGSRGRIDRVVLRFDAATRGSRIQVLQGAVGTSTPPELTRSARVYDLCLAQITRPGGSTSISAGQITNTRADEALCGLMRDGVTGIPTAQLQAEARAKVAALEESATASAKAAKASETAAAASAAQAAKSQQAAKASEQAAKTSETASSASAGQAAKSQQAAKTSETASASAQAAAANSASAAKASEQAAAKSAAEAGAKASTDKTLSIADAPADAAAAGTALRQRYTKGETDARFLPLTGGTMTGPLILPGDLTTLGYANNAGNRNAMPPRDRSLGAPTTEHFEMIGSDKYNELFLGDYWTVEGVDWVIGDFKFWYNTGDTACTKPHVVAFPRNSLYTYKFNPTSTTEGGYVGSDLYKNGLTQAKQMVAAAFGSAHILNHREFLVNAVTNGKPSGSDWYDRTVDLMNENMVYGGRQFSPMPDGSDPSRTCRNYTIDKSQLSLFRYEPWMICSSQFYWLRDEVSPARFASITSDGIASCANASDEAGVRPIVGICG